MKDIGPINCDCGGRVTIVRTKSSKGNPGRYIVGCLDCGRTGAPMRTEPAAVESWNQCLIAGKSHFVPLKAGPGDE